MNFKLDASKLISGLAEREVKTRVVKRNQSKSSNTNSSLINLGNLLEGGDIH